MAAIIPNGEPEMLHNLNEQPFMEQEDEQQLHQQEEWEEEEQLQQQLLLLKQQQWLHQARLSGLEWDLCNGVGGWETTSTSSSSSSPPPPQAKEGQDQNNHDDESQEWPPLLGGPRELHASVALNKTCDNSLVAVTSTTTPLVVVLGGRQKYGHETNSVVVLIEEEEQEEEQEAYEDDHIVTPCPEEEENKARMMDPKNKKRNGDVDCYCYCSDSSSAPCPLVHRCSQRLRRRQWQRGPSLCEKREGLATVICQERLVAIGGHNGRTPLNTIEVLPLGSLLLFADDQKKTMSNNTRKKMNTIGPNSKRCRTCFCTSNSSSSSSLVTISETEEEEQRFAEECVPRNSETTANDQDNDAVGGGWTLCPTRLSTARYGCAAVTVQDRYIVVMGGDNGLQHLASVDIIEMTDDINNNKDNKMQLQFSLNCSLGPCLNIPRAFFGAAVMFGPSSNQPQPQDKNYKNKGYETEDTSSARGCIVLPHILVVGGVDDQWNRLDSVESLACDWMLSKESKPEITTTTTATTVSSDSTLSSWKIPQENKKGIVNSNYKNNSYEWRSPLNDKYHYFFQQESPEGEDEHNYYNDATSCSSSGEEAVAIAAAVNASAALSLSAAATSSSSFSSLSSSSSSLSSLSSLSTSSSSSSHLSSSSSWSFRHDLQLPSGGRWGHGVACIAAGGNGGSLQTNHHCLVVVAGGFGGGASTVQVLDPQRGRVWQLPNLSIPQYVCSLVALKSSSPSRQHQQRLLVLGGCDGQSTLESVQSLSIVELSLSGIQSKRRELQAQYQLLMQLQQYRERTNSVSNNGDERTQLSLREAPLHHSAERRRRSPDEFMSTKTLAERLQANIAWQERLGRQWNTLIYDMLLRQGHQPALT